MSLCLVSHFIYCYPECHYAECHYDECQYAECQYAECHYAECHYAECRYAECHYAECHGIYSVQHLNTQNNDILQNDKCHNNKKHETQHNDIGCLVVSTAYLYCYAECHYAGCRATSKPNLQIEFSCLREMMWTRIKCFLLKCQLKGSKCIQVLVP
jgi:hypothetical protein